MSNINNMSNSKSNLLSHDIIALIPAYNEGKTIETVIKRIIKQNIFPLVIDDGSKDRTYEIALKAGARVIKNRENKGKGAAIRNGLKYIIKSFDYKCVVLIDADMQYKPEEAKELIKPILKKEYKVVKGTRHFEKIPFRHRIGNEVWYRLYNIFSEGIKIRDPCCGFIALSKEVIEKIDLNKIGDGYIADTSLLFQITKNGYNSDKHIKQVYVTVQYKNISPVYRGVKMVAGISLFILISGIKRKLNIEN
jgi:glycosyltransferase involved in cell wall biosynthesis